MKAIIARLVKATVFLWILFSSPLVAQSLDGVSTPIATEIGQTVQLDPTDGFIADGETPLRPVWSWEMRPATSVASFSDTDTLRPTVTVDVPGNYAARLDLFDADDNAAAEPLYSTVVQLSTDSTPPVARISARALPDTNQITLDGVQSYDVDGDQVTYAWTVVQAPDGATATIASPTSPVTGVTVEDAGDYVFGLSVQDDTGLVSERAQYSLTTSAVQGTDVSANRCRSSFDVSYPNDGSTRVTFDLGDVSTGPAQDIEIESFDINSRYEHSYDTLRFVHNGRQYILSSRYDFLRFVYHWENDGDLATNVLIFQDDRNRDLTFTLGDGRGAITLKGVVNTQISRHDLRAKSADYCGLLDYFDRPFTQTLPNDGAQRVVFDLGDVTDGPIEDVVIPSFDVDQGGEHSFDTLKFVFKGHQYNLSTRWDFLHFTHRIENDDSYYTNTVISPNPQINDLTFEWGEGRGSVTLKDVVNTGGLYRSALRYKSADYYQGMEIETGRQVAPVASVRFDQLPNALSALDAYQSSDLDADSISAEFNLLVAPAESTATVSPGDDGQFSLNPDTESEYLLSALVSDGIRTGSDQVLVTSDPLSNLRPTAKISQTSQATVGSVLSLDGSQSFDLNGDELTYSWALISVPVGSSAILNSDVPLTGFTPDVAGTYVAQLITTDGNAASVPATILIDTQTAYPTAEAGVDVLANASGLASLDGATSSAANPQYFWSGTSLAGGDIPSFDDRAQPAPSLQLAADGQGGFTAAVAQLVIVDNGLVSAPDTVFAGTGNIRPRFAGQVSVETPAGETLTLQGSDYATDVNGDPLTYTWSVLYRPDGSSATVDPIAKVFTGDTLEFTPDATGLYLIQLTAMDATLLAEPVVLALIATNSAPIAVASVNSPVFVGETATLDGTTSFDPNANALSYAWIIASAPANSTAALSNATSPLANFIPDVQGTYTFELVVSDFEFASVPVTATLVVQNRAPTANLIGPETVLANEATIFDATGSSDPDGDALTYTFELTLSPPTSNPTLNDNGDGTLTLMSDIGGAYTLVATVSDGEFTESSSVDFTVIAGNTAPVLGAVNATNTVELGLEFALTLTATDIDGDPLTFFINPLPLPDGLTLDARSGELRFRPQTGQEGNFTFTVGVTDGIATDTAQITIDAVLGTAGDTAIAGRVLDAVDFANGVETPLANMPVRLAGSAQSTTTAADGTFSFSGLASGDDAVFVEPSAAGGPGGYASSAREITITENQQNDLTPNFLLTPLNDGCEAVTAGIATVLTGATSSVTVTIAADTIQDINGDPYVGDVCLGSLPQLFDQEGLPDDTQACQIYALDAPGAFFTQGVNIAGPNLDQLPEQSTLGLWRARIDNGQFRRVANAGVDAGATTVSGAAAAFSEGALFTFLPQSPRVEVSADMPTGNRSLTPFEGDLSETYVLSGYRAFNRTQQVALSYHSTAADPTVIVAGDVAINATASLPETLQTRLMVGGLNLLDSETWTPRVAVDGATPSLVGESVSLRQSVTVNMQGLPSGTYDYTYYSKAQYGCSTVAGTTNGELYIQNETDSPYGQGWSIDELQKLVENPDGSVAIIDDDDVVTFDPEPSLTDFDDDPLVFPATGVQGLAIADFNGDGTPDVAFADSGTATIRLIYNFGDRNFEEGPVITLPGVNTNAVPEDLSEEYGPNLRTLKAIDVNADGLADLVYGTQLQRRVDYLINEGGTGFRYEEGNSFPIFVREIDVADFDNDGFDDVAVIASQQGGFGNSSRYYIDYVTPTSRTLDSSLFENEDDRVYQIIAADVDNDGDIDIGGRSSGAFDFQFNNGDGSFTYSRQNILCVSEHILGQYSQFADFNEDGLLDLTLSESPVPRFCSNIPQALEVFLNSDGQTLGPRTVIETFSPGSTNDGKLGFVFTLDANGDGFQDIVLSKDEDVSVYAGNGDGTFQPPETGVLGYPLDFAETFDIDEDGIIDLISAQRFSVTIAFAKASNDGALIAGPGEFSTLEKQSDGSWIRRYKDGNSVEFNALGQQTAEVDTQGNRREMTYDADGRILSIIDQVGGVTAFAYDGSGRLERITYPDGRETVFEFEETQLVSITEPDSDTVSFTYDDNGRLVSTTNQNGNTSTYAYDDTGRMSAADLADGSTIRNQVAASLGLVDPFGNATASPRPYVAPEDRVTTVTDRKGQITEVVVNRFGSTVKITDPLNRVTRMERDLNDLVTRVERPSDALGGADRIDTLTYDNRANVTSMTEAIGSASERTMTYSYEPEFNKVTQMTDGDGFATVYEYDAFGEVTKITDPEGGERIFTYTPEGKTATRSDENGNTTQFAYAVTQNLSQITYADGSITDMTYDSRGNTTIIAEASGAPEERQVQRTYDSDNRVLTVEVTGSDGVQIDGITSYAYDGVGNLTTMTDETNLVTSMTYDPLERLVALDDPAEGLIRRTYNTAGEVTEHINGDDETHVYVYDDVSRLTQTTDPEGFVKAFAYDVRDNIATVTDGRGGATTFAYDGLDRMTTRTNPINQTMLRAYDNRDNLTVLTREDGAIETATYDDLARRTQVVTPDNTLIYSYDPRGNMTEAADDDSRVTFTYDERNRLATTTTDASFGIQPEVTLSYTYDALDRRLSMSDSLGGTTNYAYDQEDRLTKLTAPWGTEYDFGYDGYGRRTSLTSTSGRVSTMAYTNGLLSALSHAQNGVSLTDLSYRYDIDGQLIGIDDLLDPSKSKGIAYDDLNRLVQVAEGIPAADGGTQLPIEDYAYDDEGNRTASHLSALYTSNQHNQLEEDDEHAYTYDEKGNRISKTAKADGAVEAYTYDSQNRLVGYVSDTITASYAYDAMDRRISKTVNGLVTTFLYDTLADQPFNVSDIVMEFTGQNLLSKRWLHSRKTDDVIAFEGYQSSEIPGTGSAYELYADRLGSITSVVDISTGSVAADYDYSSFGNRVSFSSSIFQHYGFTGREDDPESDLLYYRARYYDPTIGRFVSQDPIGFAAEDLNLYTYVGNDPFNLTDPTGLTQLAPTATIANTGVVNRAIGVYAVTGGVAVQLAEIYRLFSKINNDADTSKPNPPGGGGCGGGGKGPNKLNEAVGKIKNYFLGATKVGAVLIATAFPNAPGAQMLLNYLDGRNTSRTRIEEIERDIEEDHNEDDDGKC